MNEIRKHLRFRTQYYSSLSQISQLQTPDYFY